MVLCVQYEKQHIEKNIILLKGYLIFCCKEKNVKIVLNFLSAQSKKLCH